MKILRGTVFGGIAYFLLGWLVWGILLMDFFSANMNQCASRTDGPMVWWAIILSNLVFALLLTLILHWARAKSIIDGLKFGALFGLLFGSGIAFSYWSMSTMYLNAGAMVVDIMVSTVVMAIVGLVIVLTWGKEK
ncbi:MAG: hypothetical protein IH591_04705 [Bacteroidales bacterium]|nr:hypothetical protein [Bacteroidales bacterium]